MVAPHSLGLRAVLQVAHAAYGLGLLADVTVAPVDHLGVPFLPTAVPGVLVACGHRETKRKAALLRLSRFRAPGDGSLTSGAGLGARGPTFERPLVRVLPDDVVVVVDGHRVFVDDVLVGQSGARFVVLGDDLAGGEKSRYGRIAQSQNTREGYSR